MGWRYQFGPSSLPAAGGEEGYAEVIEWIRENTVGREHSIKTPFGRRHLIYADFFGSGRSLIGVENYIQDSVLALYGNTHTLANASARQSTYFRSEARQIIKQSLNLDHDDALIFCGSGATAAVSKFMSIMQSSFWRFPEQGSHGERESYHQDRWGSVECTLCGVRLKNEAAYRAHCLSESHMMNVKRKEADAPALHTSRTVVFLCDSSAHHSTTLPFRELSSFGRKGSAAADPVSSQPTFVYEALELDFSTSIVSLDNLKERLEWWKEKASSENRKVTPVCVLSAVSNITGIQQDVLRMASIVHRLWAAGIVVVDFAAAQGKYKIDFNNRNERSSWIDAAFLSPHKLIGGPGTPGLLAMKKRLFRNPVPSVPGGGTVFYVSPSSHSYIYNIEEREEGGTPDIIGAIRCGLVYHIHNMVPHEKRFEIEHDFTDYLLSMLSKEPRIDILGPQFTGTETPRSSVVSFLVKYGNGDDEGRGGLYLHYNFVIALLNDLFGIQARGGCACAGPYAQFLMGISPDLSNRFEESLNRTGQEVLRPGFARVSVHFSMTWEEVRFICDAILWVARLGWLLLQEYTFDGDTGEWYHSFRKPADFRLWMSNFKIGPKTGIRGRNNEESKANEGEDFQYSLKEADELVEQLLDSSQRKGESKTISSTLTQIGKNLDLLWYALPSDGAQAIQSANRTTWGISSAAWRSVNPSIELSPNRPSDACFKVRAFDICRIDETAADEAADAISAGQIQDGENSIEFAAAVSDMNGVLQFPDVTVEEHPPPTVEGSSSTMKVPVAPIHTRRPVSNAIRDFDMIRDGDRVLVGLSGGKDSLTLLMILLDLQKRAPIKFSVGAATVNPQVVEYDPSPLVPFLKSLGVPYFMLSAPIIDMAKTHMQKESICAFCARIKRGMLYNCMRKEKYNVLALGQHLDDICESFLMSAFHNGTLNTMKVSSLWATDFQRTTRPTISLMRVIFELLGPWFTHERGRWELLQPPTSCQLSQTTALHVLEPLKKDTG
eukprot:GHVN01002068.1.p1 GENE.GHVN01002068.1~~GHVN01002068.1.p1  ORF type:complete len:1005 (-),score=97.83 GHVN01002068.1:2906-5920(-)